jgi:hypothetical protein
MDKVEVVAAIAECWNQAGLSYAIAHGIDEYPHATGRDIDVLVDRDHVTRVIALAERVLRDRGLLVARPPRLWGERVLAADSALSDDVLEIHTAVRIAWRNVVLVAEPKATTRVGPFAIDPWVSIVKRIILPLLAGSTDKFVRAPAEFHATSEERTALQSRLPRVIGAALTSTVLEALDARDIPLALRLVVPLRRAAMWRAASRHPVGSIASVLRTLGRRALQLNSPCGPVVVLTGESPHTANLALALVRGDRLVFTSVVQRPWPPSTVAAIVGALRDRLDSSRQRVVLYDASSDGALPGRRVLITRPDLTIEVRGATASGRAAAGGRDGATAVLSWSDSAADRAQNARALIIRAFMRKNLASDLQAAR